MSATSQPSGTEHPEVEELAELAEGLLSPARTEEVHDHLDGCRTCREIQESLDGIRGLLGSLPEPSPMPAEVAGRIDAALAAEARYAADVSRETGASATAAPSAGSAPEPAGDPDHVSRETAPDAPKRRPAEHPEAPAGRPRGSTRPAAGGPGHRGPGRRPRRWGRALLSTAAAAALVGLLTMLVQLDGGENDDEGGAAADMSTAQEKSEGAEGGGTGSVAPDTLAARVHTMLAAPDEAREGSATGPKSPPAQEDAPLMGQDVPKVPDCVAAAVSRTEPPLAAERDTFEGTPAYIVVLPHAGDARRVDAYVVDSSCVGGSAKPGEILHRDTLRRP